MQGLGLPSWTADLRPGLFFDTDGRAYVVTSASTDGTITLLTRSEDLKQVTNARKIHYIKGRRRRACLKPRRRLLPLQRRALAARHEHLRGSRSLDGPWFIESIQHRRDRWPPGAIVELADGPLWGFVMQDQLAIGRHP